MSANNIGSYKISICLYFTLYISTCTIVPGFKFIFSLRSDSDLNGAGVELDSGSVITDWKTSCSSKLKNNLKNKNKGKI